MNIEKDESNNFAVVSGTLYVLFLSAAFPPLGLLLGGYSHLRKRPRDVKLSLIAASVGALFWAGMYVWITYVE